MIEGSTSSDAKGTHRSLYSALGDSPRILDVITTKHLQPCLEFLLGKESPRHYRVTSSELPKTRFSWSKMIQVIVQVIAGLREVMTPLMPVHPRKLAALTPSFKYRQSSAANIHDFLSRYSIKPKANWILRFIIGTCFLPFPVISCFQNLEIRSPACLIRKDIVGILLETASNDTTMSISRRTLEA